MSALHRRLSNRGTSVLAALVMVAVLVVVGYAFSEIRTAYLNNTQQLAAAGGVLALGNGTANYSQVTQAQAQAQIPDCPTPQAPPTKTTISGGSQCEQQGQPDVCKQTTTQNGVSKVVYYRFNYLIRAELVGGKLTPTMTRSVDRSATVDSSALAKVTYCAALSSSAQKCSDASGKASSAVCTSAETSQVHAASDVAAGFVDKSIKASDLAGKMDPQTSNSVLGAFQDAKQTENCGYMGAACSTIAPAVSDPKSDIMQQFAALQTCGSSTSGSPSCPKDSTQTNGDYSTPPNLNKDLYQGACPNGGTMDPQTGSCGVPEYSQNGCPAGQAPDPNNGYACGVAKTVGAKTCPAGTVGTPPNCARQGNGGYTGCQGAACNGGGGGVLGGGSGGGLGGLGGLSSILSGLGKGLMQSGALSQAPQAACTSDQNAYNQQLQQYQYQMQQYQYQMQLYNQQQQLARINGNNYASPLPPTPPSQPCYNPNSTQCTAQQPVQPSASQCSVGTWKPLYSGACIVNWQCVPQSGNGQQPTAQLSCNPQVADVGMSLAVAYSCQNATGSQGSGFSTGNSVSGTTTVTVAAPPQGANTATYGLTCVNGQLTASAQCSVQISQPSIVLVANPQQVQKGDTTTIGWVTSGMQSCHISSPQQIDFSQQNAHNSSVNGVASSSPIVAQTDFVLNCQTLGGGTRTATTTVSYPGAPVLNPSASSITVSSSADGASANHGDSVSITWQTATPPTGAAISLWLIDTVSGSTAGLISGGQSTSGSYTWKIPATTDTCDHNSPAPCASDLIPGRSYDIEAALYTPANAFLGGLPVPQNAVDPTYIDYNYSGSFTVGQ